MPRGVTSLPGTSTTTSRQVAQRLARLESNIESTAGAALVGVEDTGAYYTGATVEAVLAELGGNLADTLVKATISVANATGGSQTAGLTLDLFRLDGTTVLASAKQVMIVWYATQYAPSANANISTTLGAVNKGAIVAQGQSWALVETDADGEFDCTVTNTADETLYFSVRTAPSGVGAVAKGAVVVASNSDAATWSA